jgi:predicted unusual protein kinase regulating ubiquinone biosynthesis (AarF/ABC1/UbiB family)
MQQGVRDKSLTHSDDAVQELAPRHGGATPARLIRADRHEVSRSGHAALASPVDSASPDNGRPTRGRLARTARLAALPAAYAGRTAVGIGKRIGGRPAEAVAAQVQQRTAQQLFATLGHLKGGAMKVGQALSAMESALPEQLAGPYRETLVRLQEAVPAIPTARVHEQLATSLGPGWRQRFRTFDDKPVAAASIGQVHRATWSDGTPVAVKVQYPGAAEALVADLGNLQMLTPIMKAAVPGLDVRQLFAELRERLTEEADYQKEAEAQRAFADAYRGDPDICVPDVLDVQGQVLVTEWVGGTPLSRVISDGTQDDRDCAGQLLVRLLASGPARAHRVHGDPHPGNFRLLPDRRLAVLDFGSTQAMPHGWPDRLGPLLAAGRDGDAATLHRIASGPTRSRPQLCSTCSTPTSSHCAPPSTGSPAAGCRSRPAAPPTRSALPPAPSAG